MPQNREALFSVTKPDDRWEFRPSPQSVRGVRITVAILAAVPLFVAGGVVFASRIETGSWDRVVAFWTGAIFAVVSGLLATRIWLRYLRSPEKPLIVERSGGVSYGEKEVCSVGNALAVTVDLEYVLDDGATHIWYEVRLRQREGKVAKLPMYFRRFLLKQDALSFAREFAQALSVSLRVSDR